MAYNGWSNYETWNCKLWLDNDEGTYEMQREWAEQVRDIGGDVADLAQLVKDWVEENNPLSSEASMYSDLLSAAISEIDFDEIARNILSDLPADEEEETEEVEA